jgi:dephospho-CoA kinase
MRSSKATVGLTGGIASGKSTVATLFAELGVAIVDADALAREVVAPGSEGLAELVAEFGDSILMTTGELDRQELGRRVFESAEARARLNAITHPKIASLSTERIAALQNTATPYVLYEAALLVENGSHRQLDALVVVAIERELQLARLRARNGLSEAEAVSRLDAQLPLADKIKVADLVIDNGGSVDDTRQQVRSAHQQLLTRFGPEASR